MSETFHNFYYINKSRENARVYRKFYICLPIRFFLTRNNDVSPLMA